MKIIFTKSEFKHFERFMKIIQIPIKYLGCSQEDPTIENNSNVVNDYIERGIEQCDGSIKRSMVRKEVLKRLQELPAGSLRKSPKTK